MRARFTGFDSAWGEKNEGAICDLTLQGDGSLQLEREPIRVSWYEAVDRAMQDQSIDLHVWAIDQPSTPQISG